MKKCPMLIVIRIAEKEAENAENAVIPKKLIVKDAMKGKIF
jgi:hypothetical protein